MSGPGTYLWFARHEMRLAWRDWRDMMTAGGRRGLTRAMLVLVAVGVIFHLPVWALLTGLGVVGTEVSQRSIAVTSFILVLFGSLLVAQAMESVTRSLYTRGDLDLIVSSPIALTRLYTIRIIANAVPISVLALVLATPLLNVLVLSDGPHWLAGFGVALAFGIAASAIAVLITIGLFSMLGPRRTRMIAQIVAAVVGAGFAIGIQVMAIVYYGTLASGSVLLSGDVLGALPSVSSIVWVPARAALGDVAALVFVLAAAGAMMGAVVVGIAPRLAGYALAATDLVGRRNGGRVRPRGVAGSPARALRRKEWMLLRRDPWLVSQTLTQLFYLIPPALFLTISLGTASGANVVVVMVLVTVGGQLAGALAWLAISGEDAPDLVAASPVAARSVTRAKVEAVIGAVAVALLPVVAGFALLAPFHALVAGFGIIIAGLSTVRIQLWFRSQARRSHFRRRHTSSRLATFAEALTSFSWAAAAGLAASLSWFAAASALIALLILAGVRSVSPRIAPA